MKSSRVGGAKHLSNLVHFETLVSTELTTDVVTRDIEIEALPGHAVVIDSVRSVLRGLDGEETSSSIDAMISVDENQAVLDFDDEDTIYSVSYSKDRTTTGISMAPMVDTRLFDRGLFTTSRTFVLVALTDNDSLDAGVKLDVEIEYHYEPLSKAMLDLKGLRV